MSQTYTDDCFAAGHAAQTDMQNIENNFAALKSAFSGAAAPSDLVAGMWWFDTTNNLLKIRNEANNAWLSVWDLANNKPIITNLSNEITGAMIAAAVKDPIAATAGLRTLGAGAQQACGGTDARLSDERTPSDDSVGQAKLKTSTGIFTRTGISSSGPYSGLTLLAGSEYSFAPQGSCSNGDGVEAWFVIGGNASNKVQYTNGADPKTEIYYEAWRTGTGTDNYFHVSREYVTASGEIYWAFFLIDKITRKTIEANFAPDHPCMGNGGDPTAIEHPFSTDYKPTEHEIIVVNLTEDEIEQITENDNRDVHRIILSDYEIDENSRPRWTTKEVTVGLPRGWKKKQEGEIIQPVKKKIPKPDYVKVKRLKKK